VIDVIKIFEKIHLKFKSKLLMVGDGPDKERAMRYCRSNGLENSVMFLGNSNEIDEILCFSDLFLLPSEQESFGLSALEAMVHKVPIICSDVGGLSEVVESGYSGYLCLLGDINSMAEKAIYILEDKERHQQFKQNAFEASKRFDINNIIKDYESVYDQALKTS
jgi:N-acetyl-alpha-D-glucosaminyl L-malate synthase BshA